MLYIHSMMGVFWLWCLMFILFLTDTRRGNCFLEYRRGHCSNALAMQISKSMCCCMDDDSIKAWGPRCELCPRKGEALYSQLCTDTSSKWLQLMHWAIKCTVGSVCLFHQYIIETIISILKDCNLPHVLSLATGKGVMKCWQNFSAFV